MAEYSILPILKEIPLFKNLDSNIHESIIKDITLQYYPAGYQLFSEGDIGSKMYIVKRGSVNISKNGQEVATLRDGSFFGEMALVSSQPRTASAKTLEESEIFVLEKDDFDMLLSKNPSAEKAIKEAFILRSSMQ